MIHFIVHGKDDTVGVIVSHAAKDQKLTGWDMETGETLQAVAAEDIPLGHKIALRPLAAGEKVIKYDVPIGKAVGDIAAGRHVHTHNLKSARW
jgi:(2R)-sulfolactate sulfo-lyase subunit alpha